MAHKSITRMTRILIGHFYRFMNLFKNIIKLTYTMFQIVLIPNYKHINHYGNRNCRTLTYLLYFGIVPFFNYFLGQFL